MGDDTRDFEEFMKRRVEIAQAYVCGESGPLGAIVARTPPATLFGPSGGHHRDAEEIALAFENGARRFGPGSDSHLEILQMAADGSIAYWVGIQHTTARMKGHPEPVPFHLRITEVYRREGDEWKLVHRHADSLVAEMGVLKQE